MDFWFLVLPSGSVLVFCVRYAWYELATIAFPLFGQAVWCHCPDGIVWHLQRLSAPFDPFASHVVFDPKLQPSHDPPAQPGLCGNVPLEADGARELTGAVGALYHGAQQVKRSQYFFTKEILTSS